MIPPNYLIMCNGTIIGPSGKTLKATPARNGYRRVSMSLGGKGVVYKNVHELVCEAFNGPKPEWADCVRHLDSDPLNNDASNVVWGTWVEQAQDRAALGRQYTPFGKKD